MSGILRALETALAHEGLIILVAAVFVAGLVRGFSGFGTAMVYMPFAGAVLPPVWAVVTVIIFDTIGPLPNVPRAIRDSTPRDVVRLIAGASVTLPLGLFLLYHIDPQIFRWAISAVSLILLALLITGWRYDGALSRPMVYGAGAAGGLLGGFGGMAGPPVIMLYLSGRKAVQTVRANILLYLVGVDFVIFLVMAISGGMGAVPVMIGAILALPYLLGNVLGAAIFKPGREKSYRALAYALIAGAAISNLPIF